jgi:hypothetical protein
LPAQISDARLSVEIRATIDLAYAINDLLLKHDALSELVHLTKPRMLGLTFTALANGVIARLASRRDAEAARK